MTLEAALLAAISILGSIVAYFFKLLFASAAECKQDREKLSAGLSEIREQMAVFRACPADPCEALQALERSQTFRLNKPNKPATPPTP